MGTRIPKHLTSTVRTLHSAYLLKTGCVKYSLVLSNSELRNEPSEMSSGALATMESCGREREGGGGREGGMEGGKEGEGEGGREGGREQQALIHDVCPNRQEEMAKLPWTGFRPSTTIYGGF